MKKNDIHYMAVLGILIVLITGVLFTLLQSKQLVYGSITDWLSQHVAFAEYFRENFYQTGQLYPDFSLQLGAGQNMAEFIYYGLLRPEILLSYAFPMIKMSTYIMISSIALTITSTELFYYWIRKQNISQHAAFFASVIFLCAGPMLFHTHKHVMFINYMPWLILTFIGIQRYLQKRKSALMMIGIVLMILESYFYSVSALFMCGIYAIYEILRMQKKIDYLESLKTIGRLMGQVLIGVGISCFILLPTVIMMFSHTREAIQSPTLMELLKPDMDISALTYTGFRSNAYSAGMCVIALAAVVYFIFRNSKEKRALGIMTLMITILPLFCYILNGLQYVREKSLIPMIPLIGYMIAEMLSEMENKPSRRLLWILPFLFLPYFFIELEKLKLLYLIDAFFCSGIFILYTVTRKKYIFGIYLLFPLLLTMPTNKVENFVKQSQLSKFENTDKKAQVRAALNQDSSLYRFDDLHYALRTCNQVLDSRMYKTSLYSSNRNQDYSYFTDKVMGMPGPSTNNATVTAEKNSFFQSLMSVKYLYGKGTVPLHYSILSGDKNGYVAVNENVLPMGYATSDLLSKQQFQDLKYPYSMEAVYNNAVVERADVKEWKSSLQEVQLSYKLLHMDDSVTVKKLKNGYQLTVSKKSTINLRLDQSIDGQLLILDLPITEIKKPSRTVVGIEINGIVNKRGSNSDMYGNNRNNFRYVLDRDNPWRDITLKLEKGAYTIQNPKAYLMDGSVLTERHKSIDALKGERMSGNNVLKGEIDVRDDGYFVTSIPFDKGFTVRLDNKEIAYEKVNTAFVGFPIKKGHHTVEITYQMPGKSAGIMVSILSLLIATALYLKQKVSMQRLKQKK